MLNVVHIGKLAELHWHNAQTKLTLSLPLLHPLHTLLFLLTPAQIELGRITSELKPEARKSKQPSSQHVVAGLINSFKKTTGSFI